ncbi:hypothetical protein SLS60_005148 [Paraconiothyrium brasiliense]|uniref:Pentatricopeptide repeat protein n=1 Tax=Paraconiothyrium brasiliense TaxID=300254 RepID=A0ABR3RGI4_9PLEO
MLVYAIPDKAWDILWKIQERGIPSPGGASHHLAELENDMATCGNYEPVERRIRYLDGLHLNGQEELALKEWEEDHEGVNGLPRHDYKPEHLELGARMYALSGNPDRAREIMAELLDLYPSWDPSVMKTVFRAHTRSSEVRHHDVANVMYKQLKQKLGERLMLEDYDACFVGFLEARHLTYAKLVFRDMIKEGYLAQSYSPVEVDHVLSRLHMLYRLGTDISKMTTIGLQAVKSLPPRYYMHVFAHWMKSAVVFDAPEAAGQILDLMFRRGYRPQTIHFNMWLKALMRTELEQSEHNPHVLKAENIGWRMIAEARKAPAQKLPSVSASELISERIAERLEPAPDDEALRHVPKANVTTFAIMIKHHASKLQWEHVDYLTRQLKESGIRPNAELLNILMNNKCRQGKFSEAWNIYKSFTDPPAGAPGVFPDGSSIRCLWKMLRLALGDQVARADPNIPRPRELLAETVQWWARCRARPDAERFRIGLAATDHGALSSLVMHCFSYTNDLAGSLVGLHILRKNFDIFPSDKSAQILQRHAAWVDMNNKTTIERSSIHHRGVHKKNLERMGRVYYILVDRRWQRMNITPEDYARFKDEEIGELGLNLLSEFIRVILKRSHPPAAVEAMIRQAKDDAGVPDMATGDLDASQVA